MSFSPPIHLECNVVPPDDPTDCLCIGGQFWDGRRNTRAEQAKDPFLNPVEMNNKSKGAVVLLVATSNYVDLFIQLTGPEEDAIVAFMMTLTDGYAPPNHPHQIP